MKTKRDIFRACIVRWRFVIAIILVGLTFATAANSQSRLPDVTHEGIEIKEVWIPLPDGVRLAASLFMSADREAAAKFPVLLEYLPYRKDESRNSRFQLFSYFVKRGYIVARVDIRGTGTSEGKLIEYEYTDQEQEDGEAVIGWLSKQAWSTGNVGMFGISWGAFNSIQMAMRNPPALKAIVAIQGTDDLFRDDCHFIDGMMHVDSYELGQDIANILPAPPDYIIDEDYFRDRFDTEPWLLKYTRQQRDGPFWNRASLNSDYSSIRIPTFVIGGWYDGYRDSVPRMLEKLEAPVKGMMGPWAHTWPNLPYPEPGMEWRREAVRWFDHWLKGDDTGIMEEPRFAVYVREWHPPDTVDRVPGYWRWEDGWPIDRTKKLAVYAHSDHTLSAAQSVGRDGQIHSLRYIPTVGVEASGNVNWWGDFPWDQRGTDAYSLVYDSSPLEQDLEILGFPRAILHMSADAPLADWIVRISDIAPDGTVTQVAGAGLSGAHRKSTEKPEALVPGQLYKLEFDLHFTSWVFPKGHRIRLAVNNAIWPMIWPTPFAMTTTLRVDGANASHIVLPVMPQSDRARPSFSPPAKDPELPGYGYLKVGDETTSGYAEIRSIERSPLAYQTRIAASGMEGSIYPWATIKYWEEIVHKAQDNDPARASVTGKTRYTIELDNRTVTVEGILSLTSDRKNFYYSYTRRALENEKLIKEKTWDETIPRDHQ
ncbi:MAG: CocE/NonD family hydrolase [Deltaproteobacteria bacterium]|nr:CocE/NonD family hydrolase [Deltaproteobacteria bacterium]